MKPSGEHARLLDQPPSARFCGCGCHASAHTVNVVMEVDQPLGGWVMLLGACQTCDCPRFDPASSGGDAD